MRMKARPTHRIETDKTIGALSVCFGGTLERSSDVVIQGLRSSECGLRRFCLTGKLRSGSGSNVRSICGDL